MYFMRLGITITGLLARENDLTHVSHIMEMITT